jgi:hypothetical protein
MESLCLASEFQFGNNIWYTKGESTYKQEGLSGKHDISLATASIFSDLSWKAKW